MPDTGARASRSEMINAPCWPLTASVRRSTPLSLTPPLAVTIALPNTAVFAGTAPALKSKVTFGLAGGSICTTVSVTSALVSLLPGREAWTLYFVPLFANVTTGVV